MFNRTNYNVGCYYSQELGAGDKAIKDGIGRLFGRPVVIICHHAPKEDLRPDRSADHERLLLVWRHHL